MRVRWRGTIQIVRFNWPKYLGGVAFAGVLGAMGLGLSGLVRATAAAVSLATFGWVVASILVSHYVYDRSELSDWTWMRFLVGPSPKRWANVHVGFDEAGESLRRIFHGESVALDCSGAGHASRSIRRAQRRSPAPGRPADIAALGLPDASMDAVFVVFQAHEVRDPLARDAMFRELRRVVAPDGSVVVVEHLRDAANIAAFGPGAWHFFPRREWIDTAAAGGLRVRTERSITPFVHAFVLERAS